MNVIHVMVEAKNDKQQRFIGTLIEEVEQEFPSTEIAVRSKSRKLVPQEVVLIIAINITSTITAEIILRILDRLWENFKKGDIHVKSSTLDQAQEKAENYLKNKQVIGFQVMKREDGGLYVHLTFETANSSHVFYISKSDLEIIKYEERELT